MIAPMIDELAADYQGKLTCVSGSANMIHACEYASISAVTEVSSLVNA